MDWFRFYSEFMDDPKIAMMSDSDQLMWVKALCLANEGSKRGVITLTDEEICWKIRCTLETWKHAVDKFRAKGMIDFVEGVYKINGSEKLYPPESTPTNNRYRKYQSIVFERDGHKCVYCGTAERLTLDHVVAQSKGGSDEPGNLACCCSACNSSKGSKHLEEWQGRV